MLGGLIVDAARMAKNLAMTHGLIVAEAVMMGLAPHTGRNGTRSSGSGSAWKPSSFWLSPGSIQPSARRFLELPPIGRRCLTSTVTPPSG